MIGEEEVLSSLREIAGRQDPVPPAVLAAARASLAWRNLDSELAGLVRDSLETRLIAVRGGGPRLLTFLGGALTIDVQVTSRDGTVEVVGELDPARPAKVVVESPAGTVETAADQQGRFKVSGVASGPVRLRCEPRDEGAFAPVRTEWVQL
ncbi:hypothetical protein ACFFX1_42335 [Dactylosporangium sucinum]|uniref:Carboxypeptidase regulatory-like domain-containing protein n=1 Tax=Dactylosporangium sucinum TaxID=1424081 RepID=A0A917X3Y9_9ACTN|nr:hypothetical protein [Dactylosporangium sucinum]GGM62538.1 hypothetical protein GCM10007977_075160 [Dactylosporangium sucinum]